MKVLMSIWKKLVAKFENDVKLTFEDASKGVSKGDIEWWAPISEEL